MSTDDVAPIVRGWRTYRDGSMSPIERWVRRAGGDWVSLDSNRRTSGDIQMDPQSLDRSPCPECGTGWCPGTPVPRIACTNCDADDLGCTACGAHGTLAVTRDIPPATTETTPTPAAPSRRAEVNGEGRMTCEPKCHAYGIGCPCRDLADYPHKPAQVWPKFPGDPVSVTREELGIPAEEVAEVAVGLDFIKRLVGAWDCCGTCAGGVLAAHDAALTAKAKAEGLREYRDALAANESAEHWFRRSDFLHDLDDWANEIEANP